MEELKKAVDLRNQRRLQKREEFNVFFQTIMNLDLICQHFKDQYDNMVLNPSPYCVSICYNNWYVEPAIVDKALKEVKLPECFRISTSHCVYEHTICVYFDETKLSN